MQNVTLGIEITALSICPRDIADQSQAMPKYPELVTEAICSTGLIKC
jgi:hypothetical protein